MQEYEKCRSWKQILFLSGACAEPAARLSIQRSVDLSAQPFLLVVSGFWARKMDGS